MRHKYIGYVSVCLGVLCIVASQIVFANLPVIIKVGTDKYMKSIDSKYVNPDLTPEQKHNYEVLRDAIVSQYRIMANGLGLAFGVSVLGMTVVGIYNIVTGIILCRKRAEKSN